MFKEYFSRISWWNFNVIYWFQIWTYISWMLVKHKQAVTDTQVDKYTDRRTHSSSIINLLLFYHHHFPLNELISPQSFDDYLLQAFSIRCFSHEGDQITWRNVKIKVNELEGPPEDNDLCQGEHIVSARALKKKKNADAADWWKEGKVLYGRAHISHLWSRSLTPLDSSRSVVAALGLVLLSEFISKYSWQHKQTWGLDYANMELTSINM